MIPLDKGNALVVAAITVMVLLSFMVGVASREPCILADSEDKVDADSFEGQFATGDTCEAAATICILLSDCTVRTVLEMPVFQGNTPGFWNAETTDYSSMNGDS